MPVKSRTYNTQVFYNLNRINYVETYIQAAFVRRRQRHGQTVERLVGGAILSALEALDVRPELSEEQFGDDGALSVHRLLPLLLRGSQLSVVRDLAPLLQVVVHPVQQEHKKFMRILLVVALELEFVLADYDLKVTKGIIT